MAILSSLAPDTARIVACPCVPMGNLLHSTWVTQQSQSLACPAPWHVIQSITRAIKSIHQSAPIQMLNL